MLLIKEKVKELVIYYLAGEPVEDTIVDGIVKRIIRDVDVVVYDEARRSTGLILTERKKILSKNK